MRSLILIVILTGMLTGCESIPRTRENDAIMMNYVMGASQSPQPVYNPSNTCSVVPIYSFGQLVRYEMRCQ